MSTPTSVPSAIWDARATIEPGRRVAGRYLLLAPVGRGGSGSVWRAHDELLDRDVAIKRLHGGHAFDESRARQVRERAHREGRVAARLHHPRLAAIFDMTELDGEVCLVMEYVAAPSLADLLDREGLLPPARVAAIGAQVADGLCAMHGRGIVHRDVKPANIMIGHDDVVTVTDFGIAVVDTDPGTSDQLVAGTPHYMAPELARGGIATAAADVFSLGATLYAALEGTPPAGDGGNALEVLSRVATGHVQPARRAGDLTPVLRTLLDHDPTRRPSAAEAARMLAALAGTPASGPVPGDHGAGRAVGSFRVGARRPAPERVPCVRSPAGRRRVPHRTHRRPGRRLRRPRRLPGPHPRGHVGRRRGGRHALPFLPQGRRRRRRAGRDAGRGRARGGVDEHVGPVADRGARGRRHAPGRPGADRGAAGDPRRPRAHHDHHVVVPGLGGRGRGLVVGGADDHHAAHP